jgi:EmrB/QacA subfamily drug resistance transporter
VLFGVLATNLTFTIFNVALVEIATSLHTTSSILTWAITGPLLVVGVAAPILGKLGDVHGHRRVFLIGVVGSLACAALTVVAWNAGSLIVARLFSGLGSAAMTTSSWALLFRVYPVGERTKVLGWWSLVAAGGPVIGVALGGPIVQLFGWRWIFVIQVPLIVVSLVASYLILPETDRSPSEPVDWWGGALLAFAVGALLLSVNRAGTGLTRPLVVVPFLAAAATVPLFVRAERRAVSPVLPLEWLRRRSFVLPCVAMFALNFAYMGGFFLTPLFLEQGLNYSVGAAGFFQIARPLAFAIAAPAAGYIAVRTGTRATTLAGSLLMIVSMVIFATLEPGAAVVVIVVALAVSGAANGLATPSVSTMVADSVDSHQLGSANGALQVVTQVGVVIGIQVMQSVQASRQAVSGVVGSYQVAYLVGAAVCLVAVAAAIKVRPIWSSGPAVQTALDLDLDV